MKKKYTDRKILNKEALLEILRSKDLSIRKLDKDPNFNYTARTISRAFSQGASISLCLSLSYYLKVPMEQFTK